MNKIAILMYVVFKKYTLNSLDRQQFKNNNHGQMQLFQGPKCRKAQLYEGFGGVHRGAGGSRRDPVGGDLGESNKS